MNKPLQARTKTIEVPRSAGIDGFMHVVREALRLPRIQNLTVDRTGKLTITQLQEEEGDVNLNVSFEHLSPYHVIRNAKIKELQCSDAISSLGVVAAMLDNVACLGHTPIAFVVGTQTLLWDWLSSCELYAFKDRDSLLGHPLYSDKDIPAHTLVLCAGVGESPALVDTKLSVAVSMQTRVPENEVSVL